MSLRLILESGVPQKVSLMSMVRNSHRREGITYLNVPSVLATKKAEVLDKKGKGYADAKWEAEVRQKLNAKSAKATLSKQDQAFVNEQLRKEAEIRKRVSGIRAKLEHGLELVHSLSSANVEEFRVHAPHIVSILLPSAFADASEALVGDKAFNAFLVRLLFSTLRGLR